MTDTDVTTAAADVQTADEDAPTEEATTEDTDTSGTEADEDQGDEGDAETFPAEYVRKLRSRSARYRERAKQADTYATRLHTELVRATGRLADPSDLEYSEDHLDDPDALAAAVDDLLTRKPHLASRRPVGDIGQGQRGAAGEPFSLLSLLKQRT